MAGQRECVEQILKFAARQKGYRAYVVDHNGFYYGFIVTPRDNVLAVGNGEFFGAFVTLKYVPTVRNGSGCSCHGNKKFSGDHYVMEVNDLETLVSLEDEGLRYARELKAKLYANSNEWFDKLWNKAELKEVTA